MKIRSTNEIKSLDDELNLFEEQDWDFMSVVDNYDNNYEYFNDIRDTDFDKRDKSNNKERLFYVGTITCLAFICIFAVLRVTVFSDRAEYEAVANMQNITQTSNINYVEGDNAESSEIIDISGVLNTYFNCINAQSDYDPLYSSCVKTSTFADTYYTATDKVETVYDTNDCYARALRRFASFCTLNKVSKVVVKDGTYYCYASVNLPTTADINEYIYMYSYSFTKEFQNGVFTEADVVKYLLKNMEENKIPTTGTEVCIKFTKQDGVLKIADDSFLTSTCIDAYTTAVNQLVLILGNNIKSTH